MKESELASLFGKLKYEENLIDNPYERLEHIVIEKDVSTGQHDKADQNEQNDHSAQDDEILNDDQSEHSNHNNDNHIIDNLPNIKDVQSSKPLSSLVEDASVSITNLILTNPSLSIPSMASPAPQDIWAMAKELNAALAYECLFVDFLFEEEPKKVPKRDHILKGEIELHFILTQYQLSDIFTKPLDEPTFTRFIVELGMLNIDSKPEPSVLIEEN
ncbi:hypothetical protein Tco_0261086 [Tanacetum coccineum]